MHIATNKSHDGVQCCMPFLAAHLVDHDALTAVHSTRPRGVVRDSFWLVPYDSVDVRRLAICCGCWYHALCGYVRRQRDILA